MLTYACHSCNITQAAFFVEIGLWLSHVWCPCSCFETCDSSKSCDLLKKVFLFFRTALSAADVQQDSEISDLQTVISLANETVFGLINATITANYTAQLDTLDSTYGDNTSDVSRSTCSACCCENAVEILVQLLTLVLALALPPLQCTVSNARCNRFMSVPAAL